MYTQFDKALAAAIGAGFVVLSLIFKSDLGQYATPITTILVSLIPGLVFLIPNAAKALQDGGSLGGIEQLVEDVSVAVENNLKRPGVAAK